MPSTEDGRRSTRDDVEELQRFASTQLRKNQELEKKLEQAEKKGGNASWKRIPMLEKFTGEPTKLKGFLNDMRVYLEFNQGSFEQSMDKIMMAGMSLDGFAKDWFIPYSQDFLTHRDEAHRCRSDTRRMFASYEAFEKEIQSVFGTLNEEQDILMKLGHLKQREEVSKYTAAFRRIAAPLEWPDGPLMGHYYEGLSGSIKDELARQEWPSSLTKMIDIATRLDIRLRQREAEKRGKTAKTTGWNHPKKDLEYGEPMELDRVRTKGKRKFQNKGKTPTRKRTLNKEQKERFDRGACIQCGEKGHFARECHKKKVRIIRSQRDPLAEHRSRLEDWRCWVCGSDQHKGHECQRPYWKVKEDLEDHVHSQEAIDLILWAATEQYLLKDEKKGKFLSNTVNGKEQYPIQMPGRVEEVDSQETIGKGRCRMCGSEHLHSISCEELQESLDQEWQEVEPAGTITPPPTIWNNADQIIQRITVGTCWICGSESHKGPDCPYEECNMRFNGYTETCQRAGRMILKFQNHGKPVRWSVAPDWESDNEETAPHHEEPWYECIHDNCEVHGAMKELFDPEEGRKSVFPDPEETKNW